ncbi:MAG TPA: response regulator [Verrucomicrobiae bacterium]|nr:response regulator [Verrucomicrobiae bacterium]
MTINPLHVLLADDSADDRILLSRQLRTIPGLELTGLASDGPETIAWLAAAPPFADRARYPFPDLLLLDYQMPGCSGLDVLHWLADQPRRPASILWSHSPALIDSRLARRLGATLVCAKPFSRSELTSIIAGLRAVSTVGPSSNYPAPRTFF